MSDRDRLIELLKPHVSGTACLCESGSCELTSCRDCKARRLADHLIANGVIAPPCKVGDTVWWVTTSIDENCEENPDIEIGKVASFSIQPEGLWAYCRYESGLTFWHLVADYFGKTVFLTKGEAEEKLKELGK